MKNRVWTCLRCGRRRKYVDLEISEELRKDFNDKVVVKELKKYKWKCTGCGDKGEKTEFDRPSQE